MLGLVLQLLVVWQKELIQQHISGALEAGGKTIAVLGNGVNYVFPPENEKLYREILNHGGAIVSEYPNRTEPISEYFRQRNRIVSGLSLGILVVEAEYRSGTSITARFAKEQGRDVFCIPNARHNRKGVGTNILIQKGAKLVIEPKEIIEKYSNIVLQKQILIEDLEDTNTNTKVDFNRIKDEYRQVYELLPKKPTVSEIQAETGMEISELYQKLFMMELEGLIILKQNRYEIKKE